MLWKNKHINQQNRIESLETDPHKYSQLILDKGTNAIHCRKDNLSTSDAGTTGYLLGKKKNPDTDFTQFTKISSK